MRFPMRRLLMGDLQTRLFGCSIAESIERSIAVRGLAVGGGGSARGGKRG